MSQANKNQEKVIFHRDGRCIVMAAAGSGKTFALVHRAKKLINDGEDPSSIVLTTFSKNAAEELQDRLNVILNPAVVRKIKVGTLHSLCYRFLRQFKPNAYRKVILPRDQYDLVKSIASVNPKEILDQLSHCKADLIPRNLWSREYQSRGFSTTNYKVAMAYEDLKIKKKYIDFDDMLYGLYELFDSNPRILKRIQNEVKYIMVDECFPGDTPILLASGDTVPIKNIVENKKHVEVLSFNKETGKQEIQRVVGFKKVPAKKKTYRIVSRRVGYSKTTGRRLPPRAERERFKLRILVCTEDHRIFLSSGKEVAAKNLRLGDRLHLESSAPHIPAFHHKYKHSMAGKRILREGLARRDMPRGINKLGPKMRGGNGTGLTVPQKALLERLGPAWQAEYSVPTGGRIKGARPTCYKIDLAHAGCKIAVEVDGPSHMAKKRKEANARKDSFLRSKGWTVFRVNNRDAVLHADEFVRKLPQACPVDAEVISVEEYPIKDLYVYDLEVENTHCYYANGVLVHNCQDDTNLQLYLVEKMGQPDGNIMLIGDISQSIYSFRSARPDIFLGWMDDKIRKIVFDKNYRSAPCIIKAANNLIENNSIHLDKRMDEDTDVKGHIRRTKFSSRNDEAFGLVQMLQKYKEQYDIPYSEIAFIYRTNVQAQALEDVLSRRQIPYHIIGGMSFFERPEITDVLAYLKLSYDVHDEVSLMRIANKPYRALGPKWLEQLQKNSQNSVYLALDSIFMSKAQARQGRHLKGTIQDLHEFAKTHTVDKIIERILDTSSPWAGGQTLREYWSSEKNKEKVLREGSSNLDNVLAMAEMARDFTGCREFVNYVDTLLNNFEDLKDNDDKVNLLTVHKAKGKEYRMVFVVGMNENILPHKNAILGIDSAGVSEGAKHLVGVEEERRICYVAITRAKQYLVLSSFSKWNPNGNKYLDVSRFIDEMQL